jgi:exodeoxyribonuclease VII small subunit
MTENKSFEEILSELKGLVENLEMDGANLESSVRDFENGMKLIKKAEDILTQAQRKIEIIEQNQNKINS